MPTPPEPADAVAMSPRGDADASLRRAQEPERRSGGVRRSGRRGRGRRHGESTSTGERREPLSAADRAHQRALVARAIRRADLEPFLALLRGLAQEVFGEQATVVPHIRHSRGRRYLAFVVDAARPEASTRFEAFMPLERMFWTAYAAIPKPEKASYLVAVRPARGWCRAEALPPVFALLPVSDEVC